MKTLTNQELKNNFTCNLIDANEQLYYYALQLTENQDDAQDLVQETNFKALKNYRKLKTTDHKNAWLYTILRNTYINTLRSGYYKSTRSTNLEPDQTMFKAKSPSYENPDRVFDRKELTEKIRCLPPSYAKPLKLLLAGYAYKEIAKMTGVPIGTVKSRIHIAKEKLKDLYFNCS